MIDNMLNENSELSKKEKILLAASKLFLQKDFKTVSTQDIATEAGVAKGTVFHHYSNKHLLAFAVLEEFLYQFTLEFEKMKEEMKPDEIILATIQYSMDLAKTASGLIQLLVQIIADIDYLSREPQNEMESQIQKEVMKIENTMATYIDDFAEIFKDMGFENPHAHSRIFIGMLDGLGLQLSLNPKPDKKMMEQLTTSMIALFAHR